MNTPRIFRAALIVAVVIACASPQAHSQAGLNKRGRMYNPANEITVKGKVEKVTRIQGQRGSGVHVTLKTESDTFEVILAPASFLTEKNFKIAEGDELEVTGAKMKHQGHAAIIARRIAMGGRDLVLRNPKGIPEWLGKSR